MQAYNNHFVGEWKVPKLGKKKFPGVLVYDDAARTLVLRIRQYFARGSNRDVWWPRDPDMGVVEGTTGIDGKLVLIGCRVLSLGGDKARGGHYQELAISVAYAFRDYAIGSKSTVTIKRVKVDFGEILAWTRTSAYEIDFNKKEGFFPIHLWRSIEFGYQLPLPDKGTVYFSPYATHCGTPIISKNKVDSQGVSTSICYPATRKWEDVKEDIEFVRGLIEFGITAKVGLDDGHYSQARDSRFRPSFEPKDYKQIIFGDQIVGKTEIPQDLNIVFTLPELVALQKQDPRAWRKRFGSLRLAFRLYDEIVRLDVNRREELFSHLVQLLEHLHSLIFTDKSNKYFDRMRDIWGDTGSDFDKVKARLTKGNPDRPNLKMRLFEMMRVKGKWLVDDPSQNDRIAFAEKVANTRHYFTHHNIVDKPKSFTNDELDKVSHFLRSLVKYHILKQLGFSERFALRRMGWSSESSKEIFALKTTPIGKEKIYV